MRNFLIFLLLPLQLFCQELEGVWSGTIYNDTTRKYIPYEIAISESKGKLTGYSHTVFTDEHNRQETGVKSLKIKKKGDKLLIEDDDLIYNNYITPPPKGVRQFSVLNFTYGPGGEYLVGVFNTNRTKEYASLTGTISLTKKQKITESSLIPVLEELQLAQLLSFVQSKNIEQKQDVVITAPVQEKQALTIASRQKDVAVLSETTKQPIIIEKDENLIDINEDTVDYKVDVIENAEVSKPKKQKTEIIKSPGIIAKKTDPLPPPAKQIVKVEEKKPAVIPSKKDIVIASIKEDKKAQQSQPQKVTAIVTKPLVNPPKPAETKSTTEINKDIATAPQESKEKAKAVELPKQTITSKGSAISSEQLSKRKIETIRSVDIKADSIVLTLYDNGIIDGDTVSVILNGNTFLSRQRLTDRALTKTIYMTPELGDSLQLIMFAENLGSIAPNTGLLIIQDGKDRHEVRFSGDLQKNSAIILRRKVNK